MNAAMLLALFLALLEASAAFQPLAIRSSNGAVQSHLFGVKGATRRPQPLLNANSKDDLSSTTAVELKNRLLEKIIEFRELKTRDGDVSIDFGVKGGELNATSRAPQKVDFYSISKDVGNKAVEIIQICDQLAAY
jgi:hypothetical protein